MEEEEEPALVLERECASVHQEQTEKNRKEGNFDWGEERAEEKRTKEKKREKKDERKRKTKKKERKKKTTMKALKEDDSSS